MNKTIGWSLMLALVATAALGQRNIREDASAPRAMVTLSDASRWETGLAYARLSRMVELDGVEWKLRGDVMDALLGFSPVPWLQLYVQAGASAAYLDGAMADKPSAAGGGAAGARLDLWQYHEGQQATAWRFTVRLDGQYAYRTTGEGDDGKLEWTEVLVMLPLDYHLTFARTFRNYYMAEFHSLRVYAGPAYSRLDGTWTRGATERDFRETESVGVVGGVDLWLLENLSFGARADWFEGTSMQLTLRYFF